MATPVFLTVDTEFAWRDHADGRDLSAIYDRSVEPAGVGLRFHLERMGRWGLKGCFFIDPMPAIPYGVAPIARMVEAVLEAGQEVQLHCHANWAGARVGDGGAAHARFYLNEYDAGEQLELLTRATDLLVAAGAPRPIAFRAGGYAANDDTLAALAALDFRYDSSHNGAEPLDRPGIDLPPELIGPTRHHLVEVPVTLIEDRPGHLRPFQICALSSGEARAALDHAATHDHAAVTIVSHSFELANRTRDAVNAVHVRRFDALCAMLAERSDTLPTSHFADMPPLRPDGGERPLPPALLRTRLRQAEQLWSNLVAERAG
ncbi:hypothetical protein SAMN05192583_0367 [Sphingomonas gellani]|uniref:Polysaccharide deacetylase n=1 Tax=Sphingomonas gellani TaxID=1166340 RepID=A0A1H7YQI2_9SPHN|nr:polysaccharide deacetylase [Sphingomonas gellani]SEM48502.1 hypothetical protein SAMN05192583_0367 [Sphingomonas gellani]